MKYTVGSAAWKMNIDDNTDVVSRGDIGRFAEKYCKLLGEQPDGASCTADFYDKAGDIVTLFVKKVGEVVTINPMIFDFPDGRREMTNFVEV